MPQDCSARQRLSRHQVSVLAGEPRRETSPSILRSNYRDGPVIGNVLEVGIEEHHHRHPVRVDATTVWNEVTASKLKSRSTVGVSACVASDFLYRRKQIQMIIGYEPPPLYCIHV